jgi:phospholipid transport system transporter-binding protein
MLIANARALLEAGRALLRAEPEKEIFLDLASVQEVDSSALAVIFGLQRTAVTRGVALRVAHSPASLLSLAGLYGVAESLPLA